MTFNLDEARRLHDRDPNNPAVCNTCHTSDRYQEWPCPTATALGTTGRSEWAGTPTAHTTTENNEHTRCFSTANGIGREYRCDNTPHHYGVHTAARAWWTNNDYPQDAGRCKTTGCTLYNSHPGNHESICACGHARGTHKQDALCRNCDCPTYNEAYP